VSSKAEKLAPVDYTEEKLAKLYYKLGRYDEALNAAAKIRTQPPENTAMLKAIAALKVQKAE
jgi:hypothetical protein